MRRVLARAERRGRGSRARGQRKGNERERSRGNERWQPQGLEVRLGVTAQRGMNGRKRKREEQGAGKERDAFRRARKGRAGRVVSRGSACDTGVRVLGAQCESLVAFEDAPDL